MKITENGFLLKIETNPIKFCILDGIIVPRCVKFIAEFEMENPHVLLKIGDSENGLEFDIWFEKILSNKLLGSNSNDLESNRGNFDAVMLVENVTIPYITSTFFQILKKLQPSIKSLEYEQY